MSETLHPLPDGMEELVETFREKEGAPALSVAVLLPDGAIGAAVRGWADLEHEVAASTSTVFRLASVSKPFTAAAALKLAEQGRLELDAPVDRYVSQWRDKAWPVTVRQLLGHLGGVRSYKDDGSDIVLTRHYWSLREALAEFLADPLLHEPGTKYLYSRYGYCLAGAAIESAAGTRYSDAVSELVLRPSGIESMRIDDVYQIVPNRSRGYRKGQRGEIQNCPLADLSGMTPSGGWIATAADVAMFARALMTGRILGTESLDIMLERQNLKEGGRTGYGLGVTVIRDRPPRVFGHSGGVAGASSYFAFCPALKSAAVALLNMEGLDARPLAESLLAKVSPG